ncbi:MAG TPA: Mur ligase family protein [Steroidobacteraceae bacterium]
MNPATWLADCLSHRVKEVVKPIYSGPVIASAGIWRRQVLRRTRFIGITGSAGKTTTKDMLYEVLAATFPAAKSHDSNNELYNVARTLIGVLPRTRYCVQEIGASEPGALDPMLALYRPDIGIVTNVGEDHYKSFRGPDAVAAEKRKLIASLPPDGIAVLNADDARVLQMASASRARIVTFGTSRGVDLLAESIESQWPNRLRLRVQWKDEVENIQTQLNGRHQAGCVTAALATACALNVPLRVAARVIERFQAYTARMSVLETSGGVTFLRDDFKAPWWSLPLSIDFVAAAKAERKVIVLATISDYGGNARAIYRRAAALALAAADQVILIGARAKSLEEHFSATAGGRLLAFATVQDAAVHLRATARRGDFILLKGSCSDHLSRIALLFDRKVNCWLTSCKRQVFCEQCHLLTARRS